MAVTVGEVAEIGVLCRPGWSQTGRSGRDRTLTSDCVSSRWIKRSVDQYKVNLFILMKFSDPCNPRDVPCDLVEVWLEAGREGRVFTYSADAALGLQAGDLVRVQLRGRPLHGLVVSRNSPSLDSTVPGNVQPVEALVQRAAVDSQWRLWLEAAAERCHLSAFRMLKAALPAGWLGQARRVSEGRALLWVERLQPPEPIPSLTPRQQQLLNALDAAGAGLWQRSLEASGFSPATVRSLEAKGMVRRQRRTVPTGKPSTKPLEAARPLTSEQEQVTRPVAQSVAFSKWQ